MSEMLLYATLATRGSAASDALRYGKYGLAVVAVGFLLWVGRQFLTGALNSLGAKSADSMVSGMSRASALGGGRLRKYRRAVQTNFASHPLGFAGTGAIDINSVYVPLRYEVKGQREDVYARIREQTRSVVTGAPGAGKSLLLKNSLLIWATGASGGFGHRHDRRVPVLIELHRCNSSDKDLADLVMEELVRNQVRHPKSFVEKALREGRLRLLLDGLDEVGKAHQGRVVRMLRDFARSYPSCQIVVTCRDAVYYGQLSPEFEHAVRIAEFDDVGIRQLLRNWPGMNRRDVNTLTHTLRSNPPLMYLARSPLLLTMIAYLYVNRFARTGRTLPNSRVTFYEMALTHLLDRDRDLSRSDSLSVYDVGDKLSVLERIALKLQDSERGLDDRKEITHTQAIAATRSTLPDINLDPVNAKPILEEIVDRSQILVPLDRSRSQYAFRHLTLQEYLAARELADRPDLLMNRYRNDPDTWREVVKLWCGGIRNCTSVVREVMEFGDTRHQVLALECLAEAKQIDDAFASQVIEHFAPLLGELGSERASAISAFGALAASESPRGRSVLADLIKIGTSSDRPDNLARQAAQLALSESGRLEAAEALAPMAILDPGARAALRGMGELAIPVLAKRALNMDTQATDDLAFIGTPAAAEALANLLWLNGSIAIRAAWWLAELVTSPDVEEGLKHVHVDADLTAESYDFIWRPFSGPSIGDETLRMIIGRACYLIATNPDAQIPESTAEIDSRLGIPLVCLAIGVRLRENPSIVSDVARKNSWMLHDSMPSHLQNKQSNYSPYEIQIFLSSQARSGDAGTEATQFVDVLVGDLGIGKAFEVMVQRMRFPVRAQIIASSCSLRMRSVVAQDWIEVQRDSRSAGPLWGLVSAIAVVAALGSVVFSTYWQIETVRGVSSFGPEWGSWLGLACPVSGIIFCILAFKVQSPLDDRIFGAGLMIFLLIAVADVLETSLIFVTWAGWGVISVPTGLLIFSIVTSRLAVRRARVLANPLRPCLGAAGKSFADRASVIAEQQLP